MTTNRDPWRLFQPHAGGRWHVSFSDHRGTRRRLSAFTDRAASNELGRKLCRLAAGTARPAP